MCRENERMLLDAVVAVGAAWAPCHNRVRGRENAQGVYRVGSLQGR